MVVGIVISDLFLAESANLCVSKTATAMGILFRETPWTHPWGLERSFLAAHTPGRESPCQRPDL